MNRKTIIQISVIIVAFAASGIVLYRGLFSGPKPPAATPSPVGVVVSDPSSPLNGLDLNNITKSLPYSTDEDFDTALNQVFQKQSLEYGTIEFATVDPASEVGVSVESLVLPIQP